MRDILLLTALLAVCACGPSLQSGESSDVTLSAEPAAVSARDSVTLILRNDSPSEVGYNLCASGLERRAGGSWTQVPSDRVCTMELRMLAAGAEARYELELPEGLDVGEYRFTTSVHRMAAGETEPVRSGVVRVE